MITVDCKCSFFTRERCISTLFNRYQSGGVYENKDGKIFAEMQCPICPNVIRIDVSEADLIEYIADQE